MKAADVFVKALENEGVKYIFGVPGEENLHLLDSIRRSSIKLVVTRHEQSAGFMAATVGRLTGTPGVCLSTLGPGATNLVTAIAYSQLGAMPALFITGQKPIKNNSQGHFQIINTIEMITPISKLSRQIISANTIPSLVREAFKTSVEERPGAVHLELPEDIAREEIDDPIFHDTSLIRRPIAEEKAIKKAVSLIESASHPLVLIGAGANRKRVSKTLTAFINKTKIPFFTTQMGKGVVDERHPQYLGTASFSSGDLIHQAISKADLIINVGHDIIEKPPFITAPSSTQKVIHINFSPSTPDTIYHPEIDVVGDIANAIWQITETITTPLSADFSVFSQLSKNISKYLSSLKNEDNNSFTPIEIINQIRTSLGEEDIVALDNGLYKLWFSRHYPTYHENTLLLDNALATMGAGLPSGIASKIINPQKNVVIVTGDGGFLMTPQEIETAVRLKLDLVVLVLRDDGFGMIRWKQQGMNLPDYGLTFSNPDFVSFASSFGAVGHRLQPKESLSQLINQSQKTGGVHIIDIPINYNNPLINPS